MVQTRWTAGILLSEPVPGRLRPADCLVLKDVMQTATNTSLSLLEEKNFKEFNLK